jgi:hypothetical protein
MRGAHIFCTNIFCKTQRLGEGICGGGIPAGFEILLMKSDSSSPRNDAPVSRPERITLPVKGSGKVSLIDHRKRALGHLQTSGRVDLSKLRKSQSEIHPTT